MAMPRYILSPHLRYLALNQGVETWTPPPADGPYLDPNNPPPCPSGCTNVGDVSFKWPGIPVNSLADAQMFQRIYGGYIYLGYQPLQIIPSSNPGLVGDTYFAETGWDYYYRASGPPPPVASTDLQLAVYIDAGLYTPPTLDFMAKYGWFVAAIASAGALWEAGVFGASPAGEALNVQGLTATETVAEDIGVGLPSLQEGTLTIDQLVAASPGIDANIAAAGGTAVSSATSAASTIGSGFLPTTAQGLLGTVSAASSLLGHQPGGVPPSYFGPTAPGSVPPGSPNSLFPEIGNTMLIAGIALFVLVISRK